MPTPLKLVLILTVLLAGYFDLRVRRIPNAVSVVGVLLGFALNGLLHNWPGLVAALEGLSLALVVYVPLYALKGMGAGDVKLMAAIGALVGPGNWFHIFVVTALVGGLAALMLVLWRRRTGQTLRNIAVIVTELGKGKRPAEQDSSLSIHDNRALRMPHGAVIASGVCLFLAFHWGV